MDNTPFPNETDRECYGQGLACRTLLTALCQQEKDAAHPRLLATKNFKLNYLVMLECIT